MISSISALALGAWLGVAPSPTTNHLSSPLRLRTVVCAVSKTNPNLVASRSELDAFEQRTHQPTPVNATAISYAFAPGSIGSRDVPYGQDIRIEQSFRLGQAKLESQIEHSRYLARQHGIRRERESLGLQAARLYHEYFTVTQALVTNQQHRDLVETLLDMATVRYATGRSPQQDPIQAELELAHIDHERLRLERQRDVLTARINGLLHRPPQSPLPPPPENLDVDFGQYEGTRPEVQAIQTRIAMQETSIQKARRQKWPGIAVMGNYSSMWPKVEHQWMIGVGLKLYLQVRSLRAIELEAKALKRTEQLRHEATLNDIAVDQTAAEIELDRNREIVELYRNRLLPTAHNRVDAARVGYETDNNDFSTVVEAERELRQLNLDYHQAVADLSQAAAQVAFTHGSLTECEEDLP